MDQERWAPVVGHEDTHKISTRGQVASLDRELVVRVGDKTIVRHYKGKILAHNRAGAGGHHVVPLHVGGETRRALVHHLILEAFVCLRPPGLFGLHRDDNPDHNVLENLYWGTKSQNQDDKVRNGNHHNAVKSRCPQDHAYDEANTIWVKKANGRQARRCRKCRNAKRRVTRSASGE